MKPKEIEFNAEELVSSVEAFAAHVAGKKKLTLRTRKLKKPPAGVARRASCGFMNPVRRSQYRSNIPPCKAPQPPGPQSCPESKELCRQRCSPAG